MLGLVDALKRIPDVPFPAPLIYQNEAEAVHKQIEKLDKAVLDTHAQAVVRYAIYCRHYEPQKIDALEKQLRAIGSLLETNSIERLETIWLQLYDLMNMNILMASNTEQGSYTYYHLRYRINYALTHAQYFSAAVVKWFLDNPAADEQLKFDKFDMLLPENLDVFVRTAVTQMRDHIPSERAVITELIQENTIPMLIALAKRYPQVLQYGLKWSLHVGNPSAVKKFIRAGAHPPDDLDEYLESGLAAMVTLDENYLYFLERKFGPDNVADLVLREDTYEYVKIFLRNNSELLISRLDKIAQIAATLGDKDTLKLICARIPRSDLGEFFRVNIQPFYRPAHVVKNSSSDIVKSESSRSGLKKNFGAQTQFVTQRVTMIGTISWAMRRGCLDLNLDAEMRQPTVFGVKCIGRMRRLIALKNPNNHKDRFVFGTLRHRAFFTPYLGLYVPHMDISHKHIDKSQYDAKHGLNMWSYQVKTQAFPNRELAESLKLQTQIVPPGIWLTTYLEISPQQPPPFNTFAFGSMKTWLHTSSSEAKMLCHYINLFTQHFIKHTLADDIPAADLAKLLAAIHYYFAHTAIYFRGAASIGETITCALLDILCGDYPDEYYELIDCVAIRTPNIYEFIEVYPSLLGAKSYEALVEKYRQPHPDTQMTLEELSQIKP